MKQRLIDISRSAAPLVLMIAIAATEAHAQSGNTGLNAGLQHTTDTGYTILAWIRGIALVGFMITFVWGALECAFESFREGRGRLFASVICAIAAGVTQGLISGFYSQTN